jgi:hypothetical protein
VLVGFNPVANARALMLVMLISPSVFVAPMAFLTDSVEIVAIVPNLVAG